MRFDNNTCVVEKQGIKRERQFGVAAGRKLFNMLFDRLYSNKIRAIIRELYSNAYDSHRAANTMDIQPIMHLPTIIAPEFVLRDFGTGISPTDIKDIYTVVLESTKTDSDDDIGGFGLGSKTPFCYSENFTVRSFFNGMVYAYAMYVNTDGEPTYSMVSKEETTEPNGLEIKFAVKKEDINSFKNEASVALLHFNLKPKMTGQNVIYRNIDKKFVGNGWYLESASIYEAKRPIVLVGPVAYPLDISSFKNRLTSTEQRFVGTNLTIEVEIKDVEVAPSREVLSYSLKTIECLKNRIKACVAELTNYVNKKLSGAKNDWQKKALYSDAMVELRSYCAEECIDVSKVYNGGRIIRVGELKKTLLFDIVSFDYNGYKVDYNKKINIIYPSIKSEFYYWTDAQAPNVRCTDHAIASQNKIYLINGDVSKIADIEKYLGLTLGDIKNVDVLKYNKKTVSVRKKRVFRAAVIDIFVKNCYKLLEQELNFNDKYYYAVIRFNSIYGQDNNKYCQKQNQFLKMISSLVTNGIVFDRKLVLIRTDFLKKVEKSPNFINLFTYLEEYVKKQNINQQYWHNIEHLGPIIKHVQHVVDRLKKNVKFINDFNSIKESYNQAIKYNKLFRSMSLINPFLTNKIILDNKSENNPWEKFVNDTETKYPLLERCDFFSYYGHTTEKAIALAQYIDALY